MNMLSLYYETISTYNIPVTIPIYPATYTCTSISSSEQPKCTRLFEIYISDGLSWTAC